MEHTKKLLIPVLLFISSGINAQSWNIGGNNAGGAGAERLLGITGPNNKNLVFINGNSGGIPIERGRITSGGLWGAGTNAPNSLLHINTAAGETPFRVQINGSSKMYVYNNGGVYTGASGVPPENGLHIWGNVRSGTGVFANDVRVQILNGADVGLTTGGYFVAGQVNSTNLAIDNNEIMARNNGAASTLYLNAAGGNIDFTGGRMRIDAANNRVGLQNTAPETDFHMMNGIAPGNGGLRLANEGANNQYWSLFTYDSDGSLMLIQNEAQIMGTFDDASGIYSVWTGPGPNKDIEKAGPILRDILHLDIKKYHFVNNAATDKKYYGLLAQEVENLFPELVTLNKSDDGKETYTMDYNAFGVLAIKAIQERQMLIDAQRIEIDELKQMAKKLMAEDATRVQAK